MKKRVFVVLGLAVIAAGGVFAQDIIILKNGNEIKAKVLEISPQEIKYKRFDNLEGPTVSISASMVLMIQYANGSREIINAEPAASSPASGSRAADPNKAQKAQDRKNVALLLNLVVGLGIGSSYQGDNLGGWVGLIGEGLGYILWIGGALNPIVGSETQTTGSGRWETTVEVPTVSINPITYVGIALWGGTKIFEIIRPLTYANNFKVAIVPTFDIHGQPAVTAMASLKF